MSNFNSNEKGTTLRSARLATIDTVEFRGIVANLRDAVRNGASSDDVGLIESMLIRHVDSHLNNQNFGTPAGAAAYLPGTNGFTHVVFHANDVPEGEQVYIGASKTAEMVETHRILSELCYNHDPKAKLDELARMVQFTVNRITGFEAEPGSAMHNVTNALTATQALALYEELYGDILWLYRRLPQTYGRQEFVEAAIKRLAAILNVDAQEHLDERNGGELAPNRGALPKEVNSFILDMPNVIDKATWEKIQPRWNSIAEKWLHADNQAAT